jgi:hypothetical protein
MFKKINKSLIIVILLIYVLIGIILIILLPVMEKANNQEVLNSYQKNEEIICHYETKKVGNVKLFHYESKTIKIKKDNNKFKLIQDDKTSYFEFQNDNKIKKIYLHDCKVPFKSILQRKSN